MKNKAILVSFVAIFAMILAISAVSASFVSIDDVFVNDISIKTNDVAGVVSDIVPVEVEFTALDDVEDVRVKVYIEGYKDEISESTSRFRIVNGSAYIKRFTIELPSSMDLDLDPEELTLNVRISAKGENSEEASFPCIISMQKDGYGLNLLSIEAPEIATAGSVIAVDVVLKNDGYSRLDDTYVKVSIPDIVNRKVYFGDIESDVDETYDEIRDTLNKRIYLTIPVDAVSGIYNLEVEAYNYDVSATAKEMIVINGVEPADTEDADDTQVIDGEDSEKETPDTVLILTVILAIIFVVLLIVLIVLLTKKPAEAEEFGETSYY